jgi:hypothetical protein
MTSGGKRDVAQRALIATDVHSTFAVAPPRHSSGLVLHARRKDSIAAMLPGTVRHPREGPDSPALALRTLQPVTIRAKNAPAAVDAAKEPGVARERCLVGVEAGDLAIAERRSRRPSGEQLEPLLPPPCGLARLRQRPRSKVRVDNAPVQINPPGLPKVFLDLAAKFVRQLPPYPTYVLSKRLQYQDDGQGEKLELNAAGPRGTRDLLDDRPEIVQEQLVTKDFLLPTAQTQFGDSLLAPLVQTLTMVQPLGWFGPV